MAFYYIHKDGTATDDAGRETVMRTGVFEANANNFPTVVAARATSGVSPVAGDFFLGSNTSQDNVYPITVTFTGPTGSAGMGNPFRIVSVDNDNQENALVGFREGFSTTNTDMRPNGHWITWGYTIGPIGDDFFFLGANASWTMYNSTIQFDNASSNFQLGGSDGCVLSFIDTTLNWIVSNTPFILENGIHLRMTGGAITGIVGNLINASSDDGGFNAHFKDVDMSILTGFLLAGTGGQVNDDGFILLIEGCKLPVSFSGFVSEEFFQPHQEMWVINSGPTGTEIDFQYFYRNYRGDVENETTIVRSVSPTFPGSGQRISLKCTPKSTASRLSPFIFEVPAAFVTLSSASTNKLEFFVTSDTQLTDADIWAEVHYSRQANKSEYNAISSAVQLTGSYTIDPFATGTVLTTDNSWTSGLTFQQKFEIDTSGNQGADSVPYVRMYIATTALLFLDSIFYPVAA